ncbi:hypothetical protein [Streptomyces qinglanensis]|uniref:hypothetical protein n=1 Tax=Streptomyces qinglanensis TaxID=943816 RepID=UPI003D7412A7
MPQTLDQDDHLVRILLSFRAMSDRHKAALDRYCDVEGEVEDAYRRAHVRRMRTEALEARQLLEQVMNLLDERFILPDGLAVTVPGTNGVSHTVTTGKLDETAHEVFLYGQCHTLARAMSDHTGWPMAVLINDDCHQDPALCTLDTDIGGLCACQLEHVVTVRPDGALVDVTGAHMPDALPDYEGQEAVAVTEGIWSHITPSPLWRRPAVEVSRTFIPPLLASLDERRCGA